MYGGKFQGSNVADFSITTDLYDIPSQPTAGWNSVGIKDATNYRYIRYLSPPNSFGNVAEIEIYGF